MIELNHVSKYFGEKQVLFDINTVFEEGKVNCIIGRSGSGKTVLMKSIVGLHEIDEGRICLDSDNKPANSPILFSFINFLFF